MGPAVDADHLVHQRAVAGIDRAIEPLPGARQGGGEVCKRLIKRADRGKLRRNYAPILGIQALAYYAKLAIHPTPMQRLADLWERAAIGPIPGQLVVLAGIVFHGAWIVFLLYTLNQDRKRRLNRKSPIAMG